MLENVRGTWTSSGSDSMHTSTFTIFLYKPCTMAISAYSGPFYLVNYTRVIAIKPDLQRASFYSVIDFLPYSTTVKPLLFYTYKKILSEPQNLATIMSVMIDTDRPTITSEPKEHESDSDVEIVDWSIYAD